MSKDTRSTVAGLIIACLIAGLTYVQAGVDLESPVWWAGLIGAWVSVIKGFYHNKPEQKPIVMADEPTAHQEPPAA